MSGMDCGLLTIRLTDVSIFGGKNLLLGVTLLVVPRFGRYNIAKVRCY